MAITLDPFLSGINNKNHGQLALSEQVFEGNCRVMLRRPINAVLCDAAVPVVYGKQGDRCLINMTCSNGGH